MDQPIRSRRPRFIRIDLTDPNRLIPLIRSGVVWERPMFWPDAVKAIRAGLVPLDEWRDVPPEVLPLLRNR